MMPAPTGSSGGERRPEVSVIVPARNEERSLGRCLESLLAQQGLEFEVLVVDDDSSDRTRDIAESFAGVKVLAARPLPPGWSGKSNAILTAVEQARGEWLLFTDADTAHLPGSLKRSLEEARAAGAAMLSYSPSQEVRGFFESAVMPVVFAELAATYRPKEVSDPRSPAAAANGQYILIAREAYETVGGHAAIASALLEDVELARAVKRAGQRIVFRYGGDAVRTRMYRGFRELAEGWTKNLALLFRRPGRLAVARLVEFLVIAAAAALAVLAGRAGTSVAAAAAGGVAVGAYAAFLRRIRQAHFGLGPTLLALFGLPIFSYLLLRSRLYSRGRGTVTWKGREYAAGNPAQGEPAGAGTGETWSI